MGGGETAPRMSFNDGEQFSVSEDRVDTQKTVERTVALEENRWKGEWIEGFDGVPIPKVPKVALIGYAPSSRGLVPWKDENMCRVGLNDLYTVEGMGGLGSDENGLSYQCWFQIHQRQEFENRSPGHTEWLQKVKPFPVYTVKAYEDFPSAFPYPIQEVLQRTRNYYNNSISYMITWAFLNSVKFGGPFEEIYLYGIDMAQKGTGFENGEYAAQRPSCEYYVGLCEGAGIPVHVPLQADLLKTPNLYGFEGTFTIQTKIRNRIKELDQQKAQVAQQKAQVVQHLEQLKAQEYSLAGAIEDSRYYGHNWIHDTAEHQEWASESTGEDEE